MVPSVFSQTYVSVDRLEISNGDVRQGAHGSKLRGGHSPGGKFRNINTLNIVLRYTLCVVQKSHAQEAEKSCDCHMIVT